MNNVTDALPARPVINNLSMFSFMLLSICLSALDGLATLCWLHSGVAVEANPVMDVLIRRDPALFFAVKMGLTVMGLLFCYQFRHLRLGRLGLRLAGFM